MARQTTAQRKAETTRRIALGAFLAGAAVSVAANVIAAEPTILGRAVSAWPAIALLLTVHLFQHAQRSFPVKLSILAVTLVAAWVSYWHMVDVALMAGENQVTAHVLPATVDAMMYVATVVMTTRPTTTATRRRRAAARKSTGATVRKLHAA